MTAPTVPLLAPTVPMLLETVPPVWTTIRPDAVLPTVNGPSGLEITPFQPQASVLGTPPQTIRPGTSEEPLFTWAEPVS